MSETVEVASQAQLRDILKSSRIVVVDFYGDSQFALPYEELSMSLSRANQVTFTKVNGSTLKDIASAYSVRTFPTYIVFREEKIVDKVEGADRAKLSAVLAKLDEDVKKMRSGEGASTSGLGLWRGAELPRGYTDITDQIELQRCELLNVHPAAGNVRTLFYGAKPSALSGEPGPSKDWVESDTDEQLLLFVPFQAMLKLHTLQITSLPPRDDDDAPMRPATIKLFTNKPHNLSFEEAEDLAATQVVQLSESEWNAEGTASVSLRYVKFQNINSLVLFVKDASGDNGSEKVRIDRIRLIGDTGEKREMGKLQKIGDEPGE